MKSMSHAAAPLRRPLFQPLARILVLTASAVVLTACGAAQVQSGAGTPTTGGGLDAHRSNRFGLRIAEQRDSRGGGEPDVSGKGCGSV